MKKIFYITIIILGISACKSKQSEETTKTDVQNQNTIQLTPAQYENAQIKTGSIEQKNISSVLKVNGKIDVPPQNLISVSMPLGGYLKSTHLMTGTPVKKGQLIATLEDQQYIQLQQDYLVTKAKLKLAEKELERQKELNVTKASSDKVFQQAESEYNLLQINLNALKEKLKLININPDNLNMDNITKSVNIYSPINGFVSSVNVNIGKYVTPSDVLFELINTSDIHLNIKVFEKDVSQLSIGQKLLAYTNAQPDKKYPCTIILISRDLANDGSVEVHCHFEKYEPALLPGMYMNAIIETKNSMVQALPEDAIVTFEGKNYVFEVIGDKKYQMIEVETGISENGWIGIKFNKSQDLSNSNFVINGAYSLLMQLKNREEE